ncbi:hypothetical protein HYW76_04925 [Candidatus Pacearchaeota archaeon]|nr:hypothetical protein [Candidatus Pacearchaeota archaeon]
MKTQIDCNYGLVNRRAGRKNAELLIPHNKGVTAWDYPPYKPMGYCSVGDLILESKQEVPTGEDTAFLMYAAYNSKEPEFRVIKKIMKRRWFWVYNVNTWTDRGVYSMSDSKAIGRRKNNRTSVEQLEAMLIDGKELSWGGIRISQDGRTAFAPEGSYRLGEHTPESFAKDGLIIAIHGEEGADKMGEVAEKFRYGPAISGFDLRDALPRKSITALNGHHRIRVHADNWYDSDWFDEFGDFNPLEHYGYALGILDRAAPEELVKNCVSEKQNRLSWRQKLSIFVARIAGMGEY